MKVEETVQSFCRFEQIFSNDEINVVSPISLAAEQRKQIE